MFDDTACRKMLTLYTRSFPTIWKSERYKWDAVQCFQDHWDPDAADFTAMLTASLGKTGSLLASSNYYPRTMLLLLSRKAEREIRAMLLSLFDENENIVERVGIFKTQADSLLKKYGDGATEHYQKVNAITTYLWLRYPDRYYIYQYKKIDVRAVADALGADYRFKKGADTENISDFLRFYDELNQAVRSNNKLTEIFQSKLEEGCYPDPEQKTLTVDFGFFISRYFPDDEWEPQNYDPGLSVQDWKTLLSDPEIFAPSSLEIVKRLKDYGGVASCKELSVQYGETWQFYNNGIFQLAKRVVQRKHIRFNSAERGWWTVLLLCRWAENGLAGRFLFKLRKELSQALDHVDLGDVPLYADEMSPKPATEERTTDMLSNRIYSEYGFLKEVYMSGENYHELKALLLRKRNVILQGPPGVGKTFAAKRLAWSLIGGRDDSRIELVQFHQSYSYEDFVMGFKPTADGFELKEGIFHRFCRKAEDSPEEKFFFLIDEINRGNLSKIFGELLMLIESDYRGTTAALACNGESFSVPENLYLIGMMNTADRSLALIDYALRRRFSFFEMAPAFDSNGFRRYQKKLNSDAFDALVATVKELNQEIVHDKSLGKGFCIGHSYFCGLNTADCTPENLSSIVEFDILPTLDEYWFDDGAKFARWENTLKGLFHGKT